MKLKIHVARVLIGEECNSSLIPVKCVAQFVVNISYRTLRFVAHEINKRNMKLCVNQKTSLAATLDK